MKNNKDKQKVGELIMPKELDFEKRSRLVRVIDNIFPAFGISARVAILDIAEDHYSFFIQTAVGTKVDDILKLDKEIAMGIGSPTGKVEIRGPLPRTGYIEIVTPKMWSFKKEGKYKVIRIKEKISDIDIVGYVKLLLRNILRGVGDLFYWVESKLK